MFVQIILLNNQANDTDGNIFNAFKAEGKHYTKMNDSHEISILMALAPMSPWFIFSSLQLYLSHPMSLWYLSSSVNSFFKRACAAIK